MSCVTCRPATRRSSARARTAACPLPSVMPSPSGSPSCCATRRWRVTTVAVLLRQRSPLYNAIMFGARGLPRAYRELGAVTASRINGCSYCAAVHAKRFIELTKQPEVMQRLQDDGVEASLDPRLEAMVAYAA